MVVHQVEGHLLPAIEKAVHGAIDADQLTVVLQVSSNNLSAEWVVRALNW